MSGRNDHLIRQVLISGEISLYLASIGALVLWYLQTGFKKEEEAADAQREAMIYEEAARLTLEAERASSSERERALQIAAQRLDRLEQALHQQNVNMATLLKSPDYDDDVKNQANKLAEQMISSARGQAPEIFLRQVETQLERRLKEDSINKNIDDVFARSNVRLQREIFSLMRRGNINLLLGGLVSFSGIFLLTYFTFTFSNQPKTPLEFVIYFAPKLTLVIFIQAFAYFFLSLYKSSLSEIKYYQNEATNIENMYTALTAISRHGPCESFDLVVKCYATSERNKAHKDASISPQEASMIKEALSVAKEIIPNIGSKAA